VLCSCAAVKVGFTATFKIKILDEIVIISADSFDSHQTRTQFHIYAAINECARRKIYCVFPVLLLIKIIFLLKELLKQALPVERSATSAWKNHNQVDLGQNVRLVL
jgi:hypothetical protein